MNTTQGLFRFLECLHNLTTTLVVFGADIREHQAAGAALDKAYIKTIFHRCQFAAHGGFLHGQAFSRSGEAACFNDTDKNQGFIQIGGLLHTGNTVLSFGILITEKQQW